MMRKQGKIIPGAMDRLTELPPGMANAATVVMPEGTSTSSNARELLQYAEFLARVKQGVEGVVYEAPRGDTAVALLGGDTVVRGDIKASWKKAELSSVLTKAGIPNNYEDFRK